MSGRPTIRTWSAALGAAALTAVAMVAPLPASAGDDAGTTRVVLRDGTGDVWTTRKGDEADYTLAPALRTGDITVTRLVHRPRAVTIRIRFAELRRKPTWQFGSIVRTPSGDWFTSVNATRRRPAGRMALWQPGGDLASCPGMSRRVDYDEDLVVMRLPRGCVGRPPWVRVLVESYWVTRSRSAIDNPHNHAPSSDRFSRRLGQP